MKTLVNLVVAVACLLAIAALPCRAGYVYWETFNYYSNGYGVSEQSAGKWMPWKGAANSDDALISNAPPRYAGNLRLSQAEAIGAAGFQEVVSYFPDTFAYAQRARLRMSLNYQGGAKNSDFYLWMCSGDATMLETAYDNSGPGGLIVNWSGLGSGGMVPLHIWNTFGIWKIADITSGEWHDIQYDIVKNQSGITGGLVGFTIDGTYIGAVPFPLQLQNSIISNVVNAFDFYAIDDDLLLIDNIVIEDIPVDINATNFYVAATGSDANDGTTPATAWATLGHALTALEGIGIQLNPTAFVTPTQAQPLPTQNWAVINVGTGMYVGEKNLTADTLDIYRYGYSNTTPIVRNEQLHNFLLVKGAGIGKTIFVDQLCSNDAKFKVYSRWARLEASPCGPPAWAAAKPSSLIRFTSARLTASAWISASSACRSARPPAPRPSCSAIAPASASSPTGMTAATKSSAAACSMRSASASRTTTTRAAIPCSWKIAPSLI